MKVELHNLIGLAGVDEHENARARYWDTVLQIPMLLIALWIPIQIYLDIVRATVLVEEAYFDWFIWFFFLFESVLLTILVDDKIRFLKANWMNIFIIVAGLPIVLWGYSPLAAMLRMLRVLLMLGLIYRVTGVVRTFLNRNQLGTTLLVALIVVVIAGIVMSVIDPAYKTPADGIWWALVTVSTVGYGDIVPSTHAGRIVAAFLILSGVILLALITANLSAFLVDKEIEEETEEEEALMIKEMRKLRVQIEKMEREVLNIKKQLKK